jgi:hypothetical protein
MRSPTISLLPNRFAWRTISDGTFANGFGTLPGNPETLHFTATSPTASFESAVVEIRRRRAHCTKRKGHGRLQGLHERVEIIAERHRAAYLNVDVSEAAPGRFGAPAQIVKVGCGVFRGKRRAQPTIRHGSGILQRCGLRVAR